MNIPPKTDPAPSRKSPEPSAPPSPSAPAIANHAPLRVLMVEDNETDAFLELTALRRAGYTVDSTRVDTEDALRAALDQRSWDLILCDFTLPGFGGAEALEIAKKTVPDVPFIFVSGTIGEEAVAEAMRSGAQDYVMKDRLKRLVPAVARELREAAVRQEARRADRWMRESEHKYRQLFDALHEAVFVIDERSGRIIDTNRQAEHLLQRPRPEIVGAKHATLFASPTGSAVIDELRAVAADENNSGCVLDLLLPDQATLPVHASASPIELYERSFLLVLMHPRADRPAPARSRPAPSGAAISDELAALARDSALGEGREEQRAWLATELASSKRLIELMGRLVRVGGWELDPATGELTWSEMVRQIHEVGPDFHPTLASAIEFLAPESAPGLVTALKRAIQDGVSFDEEAQIIGAHGGRRRVRVIGEALRQENRTVRLVGVVQDITHHRQPDEILQHIL